MLGWLWRGRKYDELDAINKRIDDLEYRIDGTKGDVDLRMGEVDTAFDDLQKEVDDLTADFKDVEEWDVIRNINKEYEDVDDRLCYAEVTIEKLKAEVKALKEEMGQMEQIRGRGIR